MEKSELKGRERAFGGPFIIKQESTRSFCPGASAFSSVTLKVRVLKLLRAGWYSRSASLTPALLTPLAVKVWGPHAPTLSLVGKTAFQISAHEALQKQRGHAPQLPPASGPHTWRGSVCSPVQARQPGHPVILFTQDPNISFWGIALKILSCLAGCKILLSIISCMFEILIKVCKKKRGWWEQWESLQSLRAPTSFSLVLKLLPDPTEDPSQGACTLGASSRGPAQDVGWPAGMRAGPDGALG